jgi:hypothetical protein
MPEHIATKTIRNKSATKTIRNIIVVIFIFCGLAIWARMLHTIPAVGFRNVADKSARTADGTVMSLRTETTG